MALQNDFQTFPKRKTELIACNIGFVALVVTGTIA